MQSKFRDAVTEYLELEKTVENHYRLSLVSLAIKIIFWRIGSGEARESEDGAAVINLVNAALSGFKDPSKIKDQSRGAKLAETEEQSREKLLNGYHECAGTIQMMNSKDLIKLIDRLRSDPLLIRVLDKLEKKRISELYRVDTRPRYVLDSSVGP